MKNLLKNNIYRLTAVLCLTFALTASAFAQTEKEVVKIRTEVAAINKGASKYKKTVKNVEDISLEGTEATYYYAAEDLRKVKAEIFGETYNATGEFYYRGGTLIFAFVKRNQYDTQIGLEKPPKVVRTEEQRFYFAGGDLIRMQIGKKVLKSGSERYSELKDEIVKLSAQLKDS